MGPGSRKGTEGAATLSRMHPEGRLLILCARTVVSDFVRVEVEDIVSEGVDWSAVWQLSRAHGVTPLVYRNLVAICPKAMPAAIHDAK